MRRIPLRFIYDNNYYLDPYQGIPIGGFTPIIEKMYSGCDIIYNVDYNLEREKYRKMGKMIIYTGTIDSYFDYVFGELEYRSLKFETESLGIENYQGVAVVNYTESKIPYTRIIEHKHFEYGTQKNTVISREYPLEWRRGQEPYYPINNEKNNSVYQQYMKLAEKEKDVYFGGRLGLYQYLDMQDTIRHAMQISKSWINA
jgi:UDP-galactopyranose mutase